MSVTAIVFLISILIFVGIVNDSMTRTSPSRKKSQSSDYSNNNDTGSIGDTWSSDNDSSCHSGDSYDGGGSDGGCDSGGGD